MKKQTFFLLTFLVSGQLAAEVHDFATMPDREDDDVMPECTNIKRKHVIQNFFDMHVLPTFEAYKRGDLSEQDFKNALRAALANIDDQEVVRTWGYYIEQYGPRFLLFLLGVSVGSIMGR